jgi:hypothetical protein
LPKRLSESPVAGTRDVERPTARRAALPPFSICKPAADDVGRRRPAARRRHPRDSAAAQNDIRIEE